ncbi:YajQ family cyclic di-GMP-binding protein [Candidatus Saccharibacteria bacterium]|nr:YajQ family cyclic di-GMP-binding protein [Candidatus Saccharibacteria bacterium]NCU40398.1 YajQ family cyclic di-GMP-binding protein [Candidatus Saccharibacteria bacterium]
MANFSFDVVSTYDKAEMNNAFDQTQREIETRYDFRGTPAAIEWLENKSGIKLIAANEWQIDQVLDILRKKLAVRSITSKVLDLTKPVNEANLRAWQDVPFIDGLTQEKAKSVSKIIRDAHPKAKPSIQGDAVRVVSGSKDELQAVMNTLKVADLDYPLSFTNYR